jgi:hypothetical protein
MISRAESVIITFLPPFLIEAPDRCRVEPTRLNTVKVAEYRIGANHQLCPPIVKPV